MSKLQWDNLARNYFYGVDRGILQVALDNNQGYQNEVHPWSGLVSVEETSDIPAREFTWDDGVKVGQYQRDSHYDFKINAFYSPEAFDACDGTYDVSRGQLGLFSTNNHPKRFNFSYRSHISENHSRINFVYECVASPSQNTYTTKSPNVDVSPISWDVTTSSIIHEGSYLRTHYYVDSIKTHPIIYKIISDSIYGTNTTDPFFPSFEDLTSIFSTDLSRVRVIDHGNGIWTFDDDGLNLIDMDIPGVFDIVWHGITHLSNGRFNITDY